MMLLAAICLVLITVGMMTHFTVCVEKGHVFTVHVGRVCGCNGGCPSVLTQPRVRLCCLLSSVCFVMQDACVVRRAHVSSQSSE